MQDEKDYSIVKQIAYNKYIDARANDPRWNVTNYEWEMGIFAISHFISIINIFYADTDTINDRLLYGICIRYNKEDPFKIELWKKVK